MSSSDVEELKLREDDVTILSDDEEDNRVHRYHDDRYDYTDESSPDRGDEGEDSLTIKPPLQSSHRQKAHKSSRHHRSKHHQRVESGGGSSTSNHPKKAQLSSMLSSSSTHSRHDDRHGRQVKSSSTASASQSTLRNSYNEQKERRKLIQEEETKRREKSLKERERLERLERERRRLIKERERREQEHREKINRQDRLSRNPSQAGRPEDYYENRREREYSDVQSSRDTDRLRNKEEEMRKRRRNKHSPPPDSIRHLEHSSGRISQSSQYARSEERAQKKRRSKSPQTVSRDHREDRTHSVNQIRRIPSHITQRNDVVSQSRDNYYELDDKVHSDTIEIHPNQQAFIDIDHSDETSESEDESDSYNSAAENSASGSEASAEPSRPSRPQRSKFDDEEDEDEYMSSEEDVEESESDDREDSPRSEEPDEGSAASESPASSPIEKVELPPYYSAIQGCRSVEEFSCLNRIEEGTFGVVYRAKDKKRDEIVALKRLKMEKEKEGFPITSLREINTLLKAQHINVVSVQEIVVGSNMDKIYIVMEFVEHDLKSLMETMKEPFLTSEVKTLMIQLLRGVAHLHDNWILHRDLKTSNLLLSHKGILKIGDFGLAREYGSPLKQYTPIVVTLWYRAPELLLGTKEYSTPIDLWSVGCIFSEFMTRKALFPGKSEIDELNRIFKELGTPNEKIWPGVSELPAMKKCSFTNYPYNQLRNRFGVNLNKNGFDVLNRFLTYCPSKRISAEEALSHEYFHEEPHPVDPSMFPTWPAKSEQGRVKMASSPKPPSGGKAFSKLLEDDDNIKVSSGGGFLLSHAKYGAAASGPGFALKF